MVEHLIHILLHRRLFIKLSVVVAACRAHVPVPVPVVVVVVVAAAASALVTCRHVMTSAKGPAVGTPNTAHKWHLLMGSLTCYRLLPTLVNIDVQCQNHLLCLLRLRMQLPLLLRRQPNCGRHYPPSPCHS